MRKAAARREAGARRPIEPNAVYRPWDLPAVTGRSWKYYRAEMHAGRLRVEHRGNCVYIRGQWLLDHMERNAAALAD